MPVIIMALINKHNFSGSQGGLLMTFSIGFDVVTFYYFIQLNSIQIRLISFERLIQYFSIPQEKPGITEKDSEELVTWP